MTEPCETYAARLGALIDGELAGDQARQVQDHAAGCEACSAYLAEATRLRDGLGRLDLVRETPGVAEAVLARIGRRIFVRNAFLVSGLVVLKVLDLYGVFGSGLVPRIVVVGAVLAAFVVLRVNPFRLVDTIGPSPQPAALPSRGGMS